MDTQDDCEQRRNSRRVFGISLHSPVTTSSPPALAEPVVDKVTTGSIHRLKSTVTDKDGLRVHLSSKKAKVAQWSWVVSCPSNSSLEEYKGQSDLGETLRGNPVMADRG